MIPTIGRIVHYTLSAEDAENINRRRVVGAVHPDWPTGAQAHIGNEAHEGDVVPMIVVRVFQIGTPAEGLVNGQAFLDGNDSLWVTSRHEGTMPGTWAWPPR
jgi:hypothetical protein